MSILTISPITTRRFVVGKQGLWPGRRWQGKRGLFDALHAIDAVQMDPLNVVARSHQIALWGRVAEYRPDDLATLLYENRQFFDYGGVLSIHPMCELPYWRPHMERRKQEPRWAAFAAEHPALLDRLRAEVAEQGPIANRDVAGIALPRNYRGGKDSSVGLYYLWLTGELMIHHRNDFERVYDLRERIAPSEFAHAATDAEAEAFFARKAISFRGIIGERDWKNIASFYIRRRLEPAEAKTWLAQLVDEGTAAPITVEGTRGVHYILAKDLPLLETVAVGGIPDPWAPIGLTSDDEVLFLAPVDIVSSKGRATKLFDFEYLWEVYKPAAKRRWGYYTLPILWGDRLVARLDQKFDRQAGSLLVLGFWLEDDTTGRAPAFVLALATGLRSFRQFVGANRIDLTPIANHAIHDRLKASLASQTTAS